MCMVNDFVDDDKIIITKYESSFTRLKLQYNWAHDIFEYCVCGCVGVCVCGV